MTVKSICSRLISYEWPTKDCPLVSFPLLYRHFNDFNPVWPKGNIYCSSQSHMATHWLYSYQPEREINMVPGDMTETDSVVVGRTRREFVSEPLWIVWEYRIVKGMNEFWGVCQLHFIINAYEMWLLLFFYTLCVERDLFSLRSGNSFWDFKIFLQFFVQTNLSTHNQRWL